MDAVFKREYKNAEYEIVVEDDIITTGKIYIDGKFVMSQDYGFDGGRDVPFTKKNLDEVYKAIKGEIDAIWEFNNSKIGR